MGRVTSCSSTARFAKWLWPTRPDIELNAGRSSITLAVNNTGDRPIQVGSHYHFFEVNPALVFDRDRARGMRLNLPAGTAIRFEPGEIKDVRLIPLGGQRIVHGRRGLVNGPLAAAPGHNGHPSGIKLSRAAYAGHYGPTAGDRLRLADTDLIIEIEKDHTVFGEEVVFGGGKVIRDGQGQSPYRGPHDPPHLDLVITNAVVLDYWGIVKGDIGIRAGRIVAIGKAGNPLIQPGVDPHLVIGPGTEVIAGEGLICTAGGIDSHVHFICPQQVEVALASGLTTMLGGGTGSATGTWATTCTPGPWNLMRMLQAAEGFPVNLGFLGKGNGSLPALLEEQVRAGACGLKLHEDWGTTPAVIDCSLGVADRFDVQVAIHTDTLNESGFVEDSIAAIKGRTIHAYHAEGAGGGHATDIIKIAGQANVLPSSTNPTRPFTVNTIDEHLDMLMVCHHLSRSVPEDVAFAESRIRPETIGAEDVLHDRGIISMYSSDSQAMGRVGEVILRCWQTAHKMKVQFGPLKGDSTRNDNERVKRYVAKYTINPALTHGLGGAAPQAPSATRGATSPKRQARGAALQAPSATRGAAHTSPKRRRGVPPIQAPSASAGCRPHKPQARRGVPPYKPQARGATSPKRRRGVLPTQAPSASAGCHRPQAPARGAAHTSPKRQRGVLRLGSNNAYNGPRLFLFPPLPWTPHARKAC